MAKKTLLSWSSGKDSAWALYKLQQNPEFELKGLFCTINEEFNRVAIHGVRVELLKKQAEALGLPIEIIKLPYPCSNEDYERIMDEFIKKSEQNQIEHFAYGDLFLEEIRDYRINQLKNSKITPVFPVWGIKTDELAVKMIKKGLKAVITCVDSKVVPREFSGKDFNDDFLKKLPETIDPCGENGEFHSFVYDGPMFTKPLDIKRGEIVEKGEFIFADIMENTKNEIETKRLILRRINESDKDILTTLFTSAETMKYLPGGKPLSDSQIEEYLKKRISHWEKGYGVFIISPKDNPDLKIGYAGVENIEGTNFNDVRYGLLKSQHKKGYALEAAESVVDFYFDKKINDEIFGVAVNENFPSIKILEKLGMKKRNIKIYDVEGISTFSLLKK